MKNLCLLLPLILAVQSLPAQTADDAPGSTVNTNDVTYSPLYLSTNGPGRIIPFEDGQVLEVGRTYEMLAVPDRDCVFTNWQPVQVYTFTEIFLEGTTPVSHVSILANPVAEYYRDPVLRFTNQPVEVILATPARTVTASQGWQANFVAVTNCDFRRDWHFSQEGDFRRDRDPRSEH